MITIDSYFRKINWRRWPRCGLRWGGVCFGRGRSERKLWLGFIWSFVTANKGWFFFGTCFNHMLNRSLLILFCWVYFCRVWFCCCRFSWFLYLNFKTKLGFVLILINIINIAYLVFYRKILFIVQIPFVNFFQIKAKA